MLDSQFEKQGENEKFVGAQTAAQLDTIVPKSDDLVLTDLDGAQHTFKKQTFPTFKTAQVLQMLAQVKDDIDLVGLITEVQQLARPIDPQEDVNKQQGAKLNAALEAIPKLIEIAPNLLLDFASLAIIPNKQLREAYENNTLNELRAENRKLIEFEFTANAPIEIFAAYLPYLGVDFLVGALTSLNLSVAKTLGSLSQA